jgi:16S rRNA (uracil1498-N3)-methyltransferase
MKHQFAFVGNLDANSLNWEISGSELQHLERVLRLKPGDAIEIMDGDGHFGQAVLQSVDRKQAIAKSEKIETAPIPKQPLVIAVGALKHGSLDEVLPGLVELGVDEIEVFRQAGIEKDRISDKALERWERIVVAACKQSKRARFPKILTSNNLNEVFERRPTLENSYYFDERAQDFQKIVLSSPNHPTMMVVGSEAGLTQQDRDVLKSKAAVGLRFGSFIMRATTATICAASILRLTAEQN